MSDFDAEVEAARLKSDTKIRRRGRTYAQRSSALDKYKEELLRLYEEDCSGAELQRWLSEKSITVARSTVHRWLKRNVAQEA